MGVSATATPHLTPLAPALVGLSAGDGVERAGQPGGAGPAPARTPVTAGRAGADLPRSGQASVAAALTRCCAASNVIGALGLRHRQGLVRDALKLPVAAVQGEHGRAEPAHVTTRSSSSAGASSPLTTSRVWLRLAARSRSRPTARCGRAPGGGAQRTSVGLSSGNPASPALVVKVRGHVPGLVPGGAEDQQAVRGAGAAPQRGGEGRRAVEPARRREQRPQRRYLVGVHAPIVPEPGWRRAGIGRGARPRYARSARQLPGCARICP